MKTFFERGGFLSGREKVTLFWLKMGITKKNFLKENRVIILEGKEKKIELELMDWKNAEAEAEKAIRENLLIMNINELVRARAKSEIRKLKGKTSEEEREEEKKRTEKAREATA
ncbi:hypothetical protein CMI41_04860 [Candidatus Pacearchaeota archaeon]|nr:hypothetical protein [Candidatus Pacearchaeota archaeon]|tara:strand:- start:4099 stop:4440 length:342 start_codon:yes stop_codon:yes gene_type:complete